jgi:hypothetical protein
MFLYVEPHPDYEYIIDTTAENPNIVIIKWRKTNDNPRTDNRYEMKAAHQIISSSGGHTLTNGNGDILVDARHPINITQLQS